MKDQRKRVAKRLASGLLAGALALGGLAISGGSVSAKTPGVPTPNSRLYGADRYDSAVAIARDLIRETGNTNGGLVIASGESPYDALAGAVLTADNRPMVLVKKDSIPQSVLDLMADYKGAWALNAPTFYVLGGESAVSKAVLDAITAAVTTAGDTTPPTVTRISGTDRYETAKKISEVAGITAATDTLIVVSGQNWADALSAGMVSAENGWPIVLTDNTGLQASAKAVVDSYLALTGSYKQVLILGGPAAVSTEVEKYLITTKLVAPAKVRRIAGADRYQTNFLVNRYVLVPSPAAVTTYNGDTVALVSGTSPWDALVAAPWSSKTDAHIVLTPTAAPEANGSTLAVVLGSLADVGLGQLAKLYTLGGRSAVADTAAGAFSAAAKAGDLTSTLTCPKVGPGGTRASLYATLTLSGQVNAASATAPANELGTLTGDVATGAAATAPVNLFKVNNSTVTAVTVEDDGQNYIGDTPRKTFLVSLPAASVVAGNAVSFGGIVEGVAFYTGQIAPHLWNRNVAGSSCTIAVDNVPPTVTLRGIAGDVADGTTTLSSAAKVIMTSNEPLVFTTTSGAAAGMFKIAGQTVTSPAVRFEAAGIGGTGYQYLFFLPSTSALPGAATAAGKIAANTTLGMATLPMTDRAGNFVTSVADTAFATDSVMGALTASDVSTSAKTQSSIVAGSLTFTAVATKAADGNAGSAWRVSVVNSRGLQAPSVAFDGTAKTITVTADVGYHTVADVKAAITAQFYDVWVATGTDSALVSATLAPAACSTTGTCGTTAVYLSISGSEPFAITSGTIAVTVNGVAATGISVAEDEAFTATTDIAAIADNQLTDFKYVVFTTTQKGAVNITLGAGDAKDLQGNATVAPITFTLS